MNDLFERQHQGHDQRSFGEEAHGQEYEEGKEEQNQQKDHEQTFEQLMDELEQIVEQLEAGEVPLEKAIQLFQKGMGLSTQCHEKLEKVEQQVQMLVEEEGELVKKEFELEEDPS